MKAPKMVFMGGQSSPSEKKEEEKVSTSEQTTTRSAPRMVFVGGTASGQETHAQRVARRDDAGVRRRFAQEHPEMTGGEVGAARREMNTANVEWEAARRELEAARQGAAEAKAKTRQDKPRAADRRRLGLTAPAQTEETAEDAAVKAGMPRRMAREMRLDVKDRMQEVAQAQAAKEDAKRRKLDAKDAYGYAVKQAETDALPTDVDELNALMAQVKKEMEAAKEERGALDQRLANARGASYQRQQLEAQRAEADRRYQEADRQLSLLVQRQYDQRNGQAFGRLETDRQAAMGYLEASAAKEEADKLNKVLLFLSNSSAYSDEEAQKIMGWQEELKEKYELTDRDFANYVMGDVTAMLAVQEKIQAQVAQAAESMGEGYDFDDMHGYAKRQESKQEAAERAAAQSEWARKHPFWASVGSVAAAPFQVLDLINMDLGKGKPGDPDYIPPDSSRMAVISLVNTLRGTVSREWEVKTDWEIKGQNVASWLYQTGMSMADSAVAVSTLGPGSVYLMGTNAAINGAKDIIDRGGTKEQALWGGLAAGAAEVVFEQVSVENLLKPKDITGWRSLVRETLKQGGIEASEEFCTEIANICSDTIIMGGNSNYAQALEQYKSQGMSEEKAQRKVLFDSLDQVIWAAAGGFVSGVGMGGGKAAMDYAGQRISQGSGVETQKTASTGEAENRLLSEQDLEEYLSVGERQHVRDVKAAQARTGGSPILTTMGQIKDFIRSALSGEVRDTIKGYGKVGTRMAGDLRARGVDVDGYYLELDANRIGHLSDHVGDDGDQRNVPLTQEQAENITTYIDGYDDVLDVVQRKDGSVRITLGKKINGHAVVVELVSKGRKSIQPVTAWQNDTEHYLRKYGRKETQAIDTSHSHEGEESGYKQLASDLSIPQTAQDVNAQREARVQELERGIAELDQQRLERGKEGLGIQGQATLAAMYLEGQNAGPYVQGMREFYAAGQNGVAMETVESEAVQSLNDHQRRAAYEAGRMDARAQVAENKRRADFAKVAGKEKGLVWDSYVEQNVDPKMADRLNEAAKRLNVRVHFVDSILDGWANGQRVEADIRIAKDTEQPIMAVFGHEVGHYLETTAPEAYQAIRQFASQHHMEEINGLMELYAQAGQAQDMDGILKEYVNDEIGRMIEDGQVLAAFIEANRKNRTLLQQVADALRALWQKLTGKDRQQVKTAEEALLAALKASEAQAAKLEQAGQVMDFAQEANQRMGPSEEGKFSINPSFERELELWDGKSDKTFQVGTTSDVLQGVGVQDRGIIWHSRKVAEIMRKHQGMTLDIVKQVPQILEHPVAVLKSQKSESRIAIFGEVYDVNGAPVTAILELQPTDKGGRLLDMNVVASAYGKDSSPARFVEQSELLYLDPDKTRTEKWMQGLGLQLPSDTTTLGSMGTISYQDGIVKIEGVPYQQYMQKQAEEVNGDFSLKGSEVLTREVAQVMEQSRQEGWSQEQTQEEIRAAVQRVYKGIDLAEDGSVYTYDFLTKLPDMRVTELPEVDLLRTPEGKVDTRTVVDLGMKNARAVGAEREGKHFIRNRYTGKQLLITSDSIRHGLSGNINRLLTNARLGAVIGDVVQNAVPINALQNRAKGATGTYAMAGYATDEKGREFVAIVTVEQYDGNVAGIEVYDVTHAVSGRQKRRGERVDTKSQGFYPSTNTSVISIADFLQIVKETHQSILPDDVLQHFGKNKNPAGYYTDKAKFSLKGSEVLTREVAQVMEQSRQEGWSQEQTQEEIRAAVQSALQSLVEEYGSIKPGENPAREVEVPRRTGKNDKVSQTVRTILEAGATPETAVPTIEELTVKGEFSYRALSDKTAMERAEQTIKHKGWGTSLADWLQMVKGGSVSKDNTAMGWALYNQAANSGDIQTAMEILQRMVLHQRNAAQAVQATRILKQLSPEAQLYGAQRSVESLQEELNERYGEKKAPKLTIDEELARRLLEAKDQETRDGVLRDIYRDVGRQLPSTLADKWNAWRYLSMLGNVRTHVRNIMGNAGFVPVVAVKDMTATAIEGAVYAVSGGRLERSKGFVGLGAKGRGLLAAAWGDYANVEEAALSGGKYGEFQSANRYIEEGRVVFKSKPGKVLEAARKANSTALDVEDMWFSRPHYAYAMAQYCTAHGITEQTIREGDTAALDKAREYAIKEAQKATYRDTNALSQLLGGLGRDLRRSKNMVSRAAGLVVEGVLPFRKTPANILARGLEYSPLGLVKGLSYDLAELRRGNMTGAEVIDNVSAGLTGTGLLALGAYLAAQGLLRGKGPGDDKERELEKLQGHQDYSLELGDISITLDWLAPEALPLFVGVNLWETAQRDGEVTMSDMLTAVSNVSDPVLEMSCLQSLNDIFDSVGYAGQNETNPLTAVLVSGATSYLTQGLPTIFGQAERVFETQRETTYTSKDAFLTGDMQYFLGKISGKVPGWEFQQIPYIDAWGRTESTGGMGQRAVNNMLNPAYVSEIEESSVERELERLYNATGEGGVFPTRARKYFQVNGSRRDLSAEEYVDYATRKGQTARKVVEALVGKQGYGSLDNGEKAAAVKDAYQYAEQTARQGVATEYAPDSWVVKAQEAEKRYKIPVETYILLRQRTAGLESIKGKDGETIANSKGLQIMEAVYETPGLVDKQRGYLFEALGVGKSIQHYNKALVKEKLGKMRK